MNNQIPYGFIPPFNNMNQNKEIKILNERVETLEKKVRRLEKKVSMLENNSYQIPTPYNNNLNNQEYPNNYMI